MRRFLIYFIAFTCLPTIAMAVGACGNDYDALVMSIFEPTDIAPNRIDGSCDNGYVHYMVYDDLVKIPPKEARCGAGYYRSSNGTCIAIPRDNCPENYYAPTPTNDFIRIGDNTECTDNFTGYNDTIELCKQFLGSDMAEICTPQRTCSSGARTFVAGNTGIEIPIYDDMVTHPSLTFAFDNGGKCFMNMLDGTAEHTINIIDNNNNAYHGVN